MQFNYHFLKWLSPALSKKITGHKIDSIFSQSKNELIIRLIDQNQEFHIHANLNSETHLISFPTSFARAKRNSIDLFAPIVQACVLGVRQFENERSFMVELDNGFGLLFKLHGRYANVILFNKEKAVEIFRRQFSSDMSLNLHSLDKYLPQSQSDLEANDFDLFKSFPTFDKQIKNHLKDQNFEEADHAKKWVLLSQLLAILDSGEFHLEIRNGQTKLSLLRGQNITSTFTDPILASNELARQFFTNYSFDKQKSTLLRSLNKEMKKCKSYLSIAYSNLQKIESRRSHSELADILMANLHQAIGRDQTSISLLDFYHGQDILIKLKPNISLQKNAEILYKKAKNQSKETDVLEKNIAIKETLLSSLELQKIKLEATEDYKSLKPFLGEDKKKSKEPIPFLEMIIDGFQVWIGRNAKNNDLLTQKYAHKEDLWLHARDVAGSHVVIRNSSGNTIPNTTIERVAQLAAWHSKRKADSLCPVIYTQKKYIRKPKGSLPGQVIVTREEVILVEPSKNVSQ